MKRNQLIWGCLLVVLAIALIVFAVAPEWNPFGGIEIWRCLICLVLVYWILKKLLLGHGIRERLDIFIPLALLFFLLEGNIAEWIGKERGTNLVNNWIVLLAAVLLTIALNLLFKKEKPSDSRQSKMCSSIVYVDASAEEAHAVTNKMGETKIYFQNADIGTFPVNLNLQNKFGDIVVFVPSDWKLNVQVESSFGEVRTKNVQMRGDTRELCVTGRNQFGDIRFVDEKKA